MFTLPPQEKPRLLQRFPPVELSYETIPHTKVSPDYNLCLGIPTGTKGYAWLTFYGTDDICFLLETNKERNITHIHGSPIRSSIYANGTLFYGTILPRNEFVIEDIFCFRGIPTKTLLFSEKLGFLEKFMQTYEGATRFHLPVMWPVVKREPYESLYDLPPAYSGTTFHHIQYRCLTKTAPYLNVFPTKKGFATGPAPTVIKDEYLVPWRQTNVSKPQYKMTTVFKIRADVPFDIYRLFAYGSQKSEVYYGVACIPNYKTSVMMNRLFRRIKENENLDAVEESEDEEEFENIDPEKYVDLKRELLMECRFHQKFKKWVPVRVVDDRQKVIHIGQL
jgi:hypothetical protein